jgi:hypothetical protein
MAHHPKTTHTLPFLVLNLFSCLSTESSTLHLVSNAPSDQWVRTRRNSETHADYGIPVWSHSSKVPVHARPRAISVTNSLPLVSKNSQKRVESVANFRFRARCFPWPSRPCSSSCSFFNVGRRIIWHWQVVMGLMGLMVVMVGYSQWNETLWSVG